MKRVEGAIKKRNREAIADGKVTMRNVKTLNGGN